MLINLENVKEGMVLAEDVVLPNGVVLLNSSQVINEHIIAILRKRGIQQISVKKAAEEEAKLISKTEDQNDTYKKKEEQKVITKTIYPPKITIDIAEDLMSVKLRVEPIDQPAEDLTTEKILDVLSEKGVVYGINTEAIETLIKKWNSQKCACQMDNVAVGLQPQPAKEGTIEPASGWLLRQEDIDAARKVGYYWELMEVIGNTSVVRVDPGNIVAEFLDTTPAVPGKNVKGEDIFTEKIVKVQIVFDKSVKVSEDRKRVIAQISGVPYFLKNEIGIIPINFDGKVELKVSPDFMKAEMILHAPADSGKPPDIEALFSLFSQNRICFGIKNDEIKTIFEKIKQGLYPNEPVIVATGVPPKNGQNGKVEFLVDIQTSLQPKQNPDGSVDYKNVDIVKSVQKGQQLAKLIEPTAGENGRNILGEEIPAKPGTPAILPVGNNTLIKPDNPSVLIAAVDGNVRYNGKVIEISEGFIVSGDVDFSTGNIQYGKSVIIKGDVKAGFNVECGGELQVNGTIEDSRIVTGGSVLCKLGFVGTGKGVIEAKGDVNLGFIKNQSVRSLGNVTILREALNSNIFARKVISVHGKPISVAGGSLITRDSIVVYTVGNVSGIKTHLEVGIDFSLVSELKKCEEQLAELEINKQKIIDSEKKFDHLLRFKNKLPPKQEFLYLKLKEAEKKYDEQIDNLKSRIRLISDKMYNFQNSFIKIEYSAKPGTLIKIGDRHLMVKDEIVGPKIIKLIGRDIRIL